MLSEAYRFPFTNVSTQVLALQARARIENLPLPVTGLLHLKTRAVPLVETNFAALAAEKEALRGLRTAQETVGSLLPP